MEKSKELRAFVNSYNTFMGLEGKDAKKGLEDKDWKHWKRIELGDSIDQKLMERLNAYILTTFSSEGTYSNLLPKIYWYNNSMVLTVNITEIQKHIIDKQKHIPTLEERVIAFFENLIRLTGTYFLSDYVEDIEEYPNISKSLFKSLIKERDSLRAECKKEGLGFHEISCDVGRSFAEGVYQHTQI